jgi:hypothetical protein
VRGKFFLEPDETSKLLDYLWIDRFFHRLFWGLDVLSPTNLLRDFSESPVTSMSPGRERTTFNQRFSGRQTLACAEIGHQDANAGQGLSVGDGVVVQNSGG